MPYLLLFSSVTKVYEAESRLSEQGIPNQVVSLPELPPGLGDDCGDIGILVDDPELIRMFTDGKIIELSAEQLQGS